MKDRSATWGELRFFYQCRPTFAHPILRCSVRIKYVTNGLEILYQRTRSTLGTDAQSVLERTEL
ncbi:MAG: hypothetical protein II415_05100, partial [Bacteroidaceae bacterium]|nr:hypothetical protein [Bacteroidaceae bacterium]